jgi:hypothetical protein
VCGLSLANNYILRPWAIAILSASGKTFEFPVIDLSLMIPIMTGMLGLAGMRTYEKKQGVTKKQEKISLFSCMHRFILLAC